MTDTPANPARQAPTAVLAADPQQVVASAWADQALWSQVANQIGDSIRLWRARAAVAGVAGLFLSLLAGSMAAGSVGQKVVATLGVLLLALVPFLQQRLLSADRVLAWTRARNVAEQLKEAIYRHLMGALPPVPLDDGSPPPDPAGPGNLVRRCRAIKRAAADLALLAATAKPEPRQRRTAMTLADYLADRLDGQIQYHRKSSMAAGSSAQRLQQLEFALGLLTVLLGALAGNLLPAAATPEAVQSSPLAPWLALIASTAMAVSSHIAATRNLELAAKYFATHDLLKTLRDEWAVSPDRDAPARVLQLVDAVERCLAAEHGAWVGDWQQAAQQGTVAGARFSAAGAVPAAGAAAVVGTVVGTTAAAAADPATGSEPDPPPETTDPATAEPGGPADPANEPTAEAPAAPAADTAANLVANPVATGRPAD
jgi:hypothetical protein